MKKLFVFLVLLVFLGSCSNSGNGELTGVKGRKRYYQPDPFGMVYIPMGSYTMGVADEDVPYAQLNNPRTVSVAAFYMDQTEITNNEYRQFVYWVRDSIARRILGEIKPELYFIAENKKTGETFDPPYLSSAVANDSLFSPYQNSRNAGLAGQYPHPPSLWSQ